MQKQDTIQQVSKWGVLVSGGTQLGGAAPLGMPVAIRKITSYSPGSPYFVNVALERMLVDRWGISVGLTLGGKGMDTAAEVKGYKTTFRTGDAAADYVSGYFYGKIRTRVNNHYLSLPINVSYKLNPKLSVYAGPYISLALYKRFTGEAVEGYMRKDSPVGEKQQIQNAPYDFSEYLRTVDYGFQAGSNYFLSSSLFMKAQLDYGFTNIMQNSFQSIDFALHNIYLNVGFGWRIR